MASFGRKANALCSRRFRESHKRAAGSSRKLISHFLLRHSSQPQCINEQEFLWFQFCLLFFLSQRTSKFLSKYKRRRKLDCGFQPPCFSLSFFLWEQTSTLFPRPYWNWNPWNREMRHQRLIKVDRSTKVKNQSSNLLVAGWCCSVVSAALLFVFIIRNRRKGRFGDSSRRLSARIPHYWLGDRHPSGILLKERRRM